MTHVLIQNSGGQLYTEALDWNESQTSSPAIRDVPLRTSGQVVDTGTWVLQPRILNVKIRLSDAEKTTLQTIFDANMITTVAAYFDGDSKRWAYNGWFSKSPLTYELAVDNFSVERKWMVDLEFTVETFDYT
jgi:hypothetical protein